MLRKFSIFLICLSPIGSFASDFDEVLSTVVGNNLTQKSILASDIASVAEMKAENTLSKLLSFLTKVYGEQKGSVINVTFQFRSHLTGPAFMLPEARP